MLVANLIVVALLLVVGCHAQYVPRIACPEYFEYIPFGYHYVGKITLPVITTDLTELEVHFSQREPVLSNYYGRITLFDDKPTTINKIEAGRPISYRVDFPLPHVLPKLTRITVNGEDICSAREYPLPSTRIFLQHTLQHTVRSIVRPLQIVPNFVNNDIQTTSPRNVYDLPPYQYSPNYSPSVFIVPENPTPTTNYPTEAQRPQQPPRSGNTVGQQFNPTGNLNEICGRENTLSGLVFGGSELRRGEFPWLTAIYQKKSAGLRFLCGGSLISARSVVTAAHCFRFDSITADRVVVSLGRHNLESYSETGVATREIERLLVHPEYNQSVFPDADLAILHLQQPVEFSQYIRPICLWRGSDDTSLIVGQVAVVAGWGADDLGNSFSALPRKVNANIVSDSECLRSSQAYSVLTSPRTFCAGNRDGTGPCMGDSGGGLMLNRNDRWYLRGIVSAGQTKQHKCNLQEYVVYCDVAKHATWISDNMLT